MLSIILSGSSKSSCEKCHYCNIIFTGGWNNDNNYKSWDEILAWSDEREGWEEVGKMKEGRAGHAITSINVEEVAAICD